MSTSLERKIEAVLSPEEVKPYPETRNYSGLGSLRLFFSQALAIIHKDLTAELRTKEIFTATFLFALMSIVIFNFTFDLKAVDAVVVAPGILWVAFIFSGVLGLNRSFVKEKDQGSLEGLLLSPISREAIFLGKMAGNFLFMTILEAVTFPIFALLSNMPVVTPGLIPVFLLGTLGFASVGTLLSAMAANTRAREVLLPILLLPIVVPVIIAAVKATGDILLGASWEQIYPWLGLLGAFDIIYLVIGLVVFEYVIGE